VTTPAVWCLYAAPVSFILYQFLRVYDLLTELLDEQMAFAFIRLMALAERICDPKRINDRRKERRDYLLFITSATGEAAVVADTQDTMHHDIDMLCCASCLRW